MYMRILRRISLCVIALGTVRVLAHVYQRVIYSLYRVSGVVLGTRTPRTQIRVRRCIKSVL